MPLSGRHILIFSYDPVNPSAFVSKVVWINEDLTWLRLERLDHLAQKFKHKCDTHEDWTKGKEDLLGNTDYKNCSLNELKVWPTISYSYPCHFHVMATFCPFFNCWFGFNSECSTRLSHMQHFAQSVGHGGALVETMTFNRRVVDSTPALAAT